MKNLLQNFLFCGIWSLVILLIGVFVSTLFDPYPVDWKYLLFCWALSTGIGMMVPEDDKIFKKRRKK